MRVSCSGAKDCGIGGCLWRKREMERQAGVKVYLFVRKIMFALKEDITREKDERKSNTD